MKAILFSVTLCLFLPTQTGNGAISQQGNADGNSLEKYIEQAVHRIPIDVAMRRVDKVLYSLQSRKVDSLERLINNHSHNR